MCSIQHTSPSELSVSIEAIYNIGYVVVLREDLII